MYDFVIEARDLGLYRFVTDNGAGGLSSSIGEMSTQCGGCEMDLDAACSEVVGRAAADDPNLVKPNAFGEVQDWAGCKAPDLSVPGHHL